MKKKRKRICTYCNNEATTRDHVPPKVIFPKPRPSDLITVPSCQYCNHEAHLDDQYFAYVLTQEQFHGDIHPDLNKVRQSICSSMKRPESDQFRRSILSQMKNIELLTPSGISIGSAVTYKCDKERILKVVKRIAKGLFRHHVGKRLPPETTVKSELIRNSEDLQFTSDILANVKSKSYTIGNGSFLYRYSICDDQKESSFWLMDFYGAFRFTSLTLGSPFTSFQRNSDIEQSRD